MIHIIDNYYVDGGTRDYTLLKDTGKTDKNGKRLYKPVSYHSDVAGAVENVRKIKCRELTAEEDMTLCEAVKAFKAIAEEMRQVTEELR